MNKNPIYKYITSVSLNWVKSLLKNKSTKSFPISKDKINGSVDIFIDLVKIRAMKYTSSC